MLITGSLRRKNDCYDGRGRSHDARASIQSRPCHHRFLFPFGFGYRLLSEAIRKDRRRFLSGRPRDDRVGRRPGFRLGEPWLSRAAGLGGFRLSIRHSCRALVLDWRDSCDGVSRRRDDALLLHFKNAFGPGLSATALRLRGQRAQRRHLCDYDDSHVRRAYVRHGRGDEGRARMGHQLQHLGLISYRGNLRCGGRAIFRNLQ